jgi:hypothetical protein
MGMYDQLIEAVRQSGREIFWQGAVSDDEVSRLQKLLGCEFPQSYKRFLSEYGGGGPVGAEVSGIEDGDASKQTGGTVYADTLACRDRYGLASNLVVIYLHDDEVCWCLDVGAMQAGECPVVAYDLFQRRRDRQIAETFDAFMRHHLSLYAE